ncbi:hydrogenase 4 subunit B [Virgisporangium ochraceum]|uniref:Hydrogenase 4 subunit B n=1 Tax=Virgisporangium ochraceum TaxID=65505 RepID=A0A8J3ZUW9_9ACTN|nr:proton-conducting transporter membrane subunit [Virgisporangium ochraceum]GIJ70637.1 hydrogenase 4 subunit B [Virgisporangium ochraceum]
MPDVIPGPGPFALVAFLFAAGGLCGHGGVLLARLRLLGIESAKTWSMRAALAFAAVGSTAAVIISVSLINCAAGDCVRTVRVLSVRAPVADVPALDLTFHHDGLADVFISLVGFCAACVAVYSFGWLRDDPLRHSVAGSFNLFVASLLLTLLVNNVFWLLVALELITLCSADLVRYRGRIRQEPGRSRTAVQTYVLVSHVGLMFLLAGLLPVVVGGSTLDFDVLRKGGESPVPHLSFALVITGIAIRSGVVPFHFWVPVVHTHLPTNVHAMMSAVMLKVPVYLAIRLILEGVIGPVAWWWGTVVLLLAGITALVTVFYALLSKNLKVALAYHSVENIGIIFAGIGMALMFSDARFSGNPAIRGAAALALLASLYHVVNHAVFKTLLFLGASSIEKLTGTLETRRLGGLLRRSPWVGGTFLIGATAIAGLPPLNGFVSEWLTLQTLFSGQAIYRSGAAVALLAMVALVGALITLAIAFATTALAFIKIAGESLLGEPRDRSPGGGVTWSMRVALGALAGCCVLVGLQPWLLVPSLSKALPPSGLDPAVLDADPTALTIHIPGVLDDDSYRTVLPTWPLLVLAVVPAVITLGVAASRWSRRPVWVGGEPFEPQTMQYTGAAMSGLIWGPIARKSSEPATGPLPESFEISPGQRVAEVSNRAFNIMVMRTKAVSGWIGDRLQSGDVRAYLLYIFAAVVMVLIVLALS